MVKQIILIHTWDTMKSWKLLTIASLKNIIFLKQYILIANMWEHLIKKREKNTCNSATQG